ncbi:MAG: hypothetical protein HY548_06345, partial [Elusimicrobia bacterium]|nr:hypothetical protein [Elusimicrobiota bacterium]
GTILRSAVAELGNRNDFAVHLGGDDFAFLSTPARAEVVSVRILENVESLIPMQYDEDSRERGHALGQDASGKPVQTPFLSFSVGLVNAVAGLYRHPAQLQDRARQALAEAKKLGGNQVAKLS